MHRLNWAIFILQFVIPAFAQSEMPWTKVMCEKQKLSASRQGASHAKSPEQLLMRSIQTCDYETSTRLIQSGMNLNFFFDSSNTPLDIALRFGENNVVAEMLEHGADPNKSSRENSFGTPLMAAALAGNITATRLLLEHKADPNELDIYHATALMYAAERGQMEIVNLLLDRGANPCIRDKFGKTASDVAQGDRSKLISDMLLAAIKAKCGQKSNAASQETTSSNQGQGGCGPLDGTTMTDGCPTQSLFWTEGVNVK